MMGGQQVLSGGFRNNQTMGGYDSDVEGAGAATGGMGGSFGDKAVRQNDCGDIAEDSPSSPDLSPFQMRRAFIRKVYGILSLQLLLTCAIIAPFLFHQPLRDYARRNQWMYWTAFAVTFVSVGQVSDGRVSRPTCCCCSRPA